MNAVGARLGRVVTAAVVAAAGAGAALGWLLRHRGPPRPVPVTRCPLHGIAYDVELEVCPECSKAQAAAGSGRAAPPATTGDAR